MRIIESSSIIPENYFTFTTEPEQGSETIANVYRFFPIRKGNTSFGVFWDSEKTMEELVDEAAKYKVTLGETVAEIETKLGEYSMFSTYKGRKFNTVHSRIHKQTLPLPFEPDKVDYIETTPLVRVNGDISHIAINTPQANQHSIVLHSSENATPSLMDFIAKTNIVRVTTNELTNAFTQIKLMQPS